jgi:hypothetical protein
MTASPPPRYLAASVLALSLAWAIGPAVADAGGPQPKPDFTIQTHETLTVDELGPGWEGTWSMNGVVEDSGFVTVVHSGISIYGFSVLWLDGEAGSMTISAWPYDWLTEEPIDYFWVDEGTGAYETWVGASGTFHAHYGRTKGGHTLKGFLP